MKVFLTGATGYVGRAVTAQLLMGGHQVKGLIRPGSAAKLGPLAKRIEAFEGTLSDSPDPLAQAMADCDAVIHLVGIIREFPAQGITFEKLHYEATVRMVDGAKAAGISRFVHMSALGVGPQATAPYLTTKRRAEEYLMASGLEYTIFRPSGIFGPEDQMFNYFAQLLKQSPITPVIGDGRYRMQPVALETVAEAFVKALESPLAKGKTYELGGPVSYSYDEILQIIGKVLGRKVRLLHTPLGLMKPIVKMFERFSFFPITTNQLTMLLSGNTTEDFSAYADLNLQPVDFPTTIATYMK